MRHRFFFFLALFCFTLASCQKTSEKDHFSIDKESFTRSSFDGESFNDSRFFGVSESDAQAFVFSRDKNVRIKSVTPYVYQGETAFYIINLDKGWRIVSADLRARALLAKGENGSIPASLERNSNFSFWLDDIATQILSLKTSNNQTMDASWGSVGRKHLSLFREAKLRSDPVNPDSVWVVLLEQSDTTESIQTNVPHLMATKWGQESPWNNNCPKNNNMESYFTGCVPTAVSQLLYYYHFLSNSPSGLYHSISILSTQPYYSQVYNPMSGEYVQVYLGETTNLSRAEYCDSCSRWDMMPLDSLSAASNTAGASYVSDLMVDVGNRLNAVYSNSATTVFPMPNSLQIDLSPCNINYSWTLYNSALKTTTVFLNLENAQPVLVTATDVMQNGHAWVIDGGYRKQTIIHNYYSYHYVPYDLIDYYSQSSVYVEFFISLQDLQHFYPNAPRVIKYTDSYRERYFLMNWGYDGYLDDGHYSCSINDNWDVFSESKSIYYNITPSSSFMYYAQ